jgi:hypothetical protein
LRRHVSNDARMALCSAAASSASASIGRSAKNAQPVGHTADEVRRMKHRGSHLHVGHAASHTPSRCRRSPPVDRVWIGYTG